MKSPPQSSSGGDLTRSGCRRLQKMFDILTEAGKAAFTVKGRAA
jgi:hypothetical protein